MKRPWVTIVAVLLGGLGLGAALVGRPAAPAHDVRIVALPPTTSTTSTTLEPVTTTTTARTIPATTTTTTAPKPRVTTTTTTSTTAATTTSTTSPPATATTIPTPDRSNVSIVVANAGNSKGIARAEADRLVALGYPKPLTDDAVQPSSQTIVYARAGDEAEALQLLADVGLAGNRLQPFPSANAPITTLDAKADLILALGTDWPT
jgi:hypothetical protein